MNVGAQERQTLGGPQTLVVDILADENDGNYSAGDLSLREALGLANGNVGISETINFHGSLIGGTIVLTHGALSITDPVWVNGPGADLLTIDASGSDPTPSTNNGDGGQVFRIETRGGLFDATISGLTMTGGDSDFYDGTGGAIFNEANLTISGVTIRDNFSVGSGGGINHTYAGSLSITNSTISGNSTSGSGGGIYFHNYNPSAPQITISNSTISGNTAAHRGGGLEIGAGLAVISSSTITNNTSSTSEGGGVSSQGSAFYTRTEVTSTIIAGNAGGDVNFTSSGSGGINTFLSHGYNLIGTGNATGNFNQPGDQTGITNPLLFPLAYNGGPTMTHALRAGSPALDAGNPAFVGPPANDQRSAPFVRVFDNDGVGGARIDIGSYERQAVSGLNLVVDTLVDENDVNYGAGDLSLREAILLANGSVGADTITFSPSLTNGTILLKLGELLINDSLTITGLGASLLTIDASGNDPTPNTKNLDGSRVLSIDDGISSTFITVSLSGLTLTGGDVSGAGGAIRTEEHLTVADCTIIDNAAISSGGGIRGGQASNLTVTGSTISGNFANQGGGISSVNGNVLSVSGSTVSDNTATYGGGLFHTGSSSWSVTRSTISGNVALSGGGVYNRDAQFGISYSTISGNTASYGGGLLEKYGYLRVLNCTISGNQSPNSNGGGIEVVNATMYVFDSTISGNTSGSGGGVLSYFSTSKIDSSTITNNFGSVAGGGVNVFGGTLTMSHTIVAGNTSVASSRDISGPVTATFSIIGDSTGASITNNGGNQIGTAGSPINPLLGPLADNLGPTKTHALLPGSPAIDTGSPTYIAIPSVDQRGDPFARIIDGDGVGGAIVDIGAFELQPPPPSASGDYAEDGVVGASDYILWRKTLGNSVSSYSGADGNGDGTINQADYSVWRAHFGQVLGPGTGASVEGGVGSAEGTSGSVGGVSSSAGAAFFAEAQGVQSAQQPSALPGVDAAFNALDLETRAQPVPTVAAFGIAGPASRGARSIAPHPSPLPRGEGNRRDDALVAWLDARGDGRGKEVMDTIQGDGRVNAHAEADAAFGALDVAFEAMMSGVSR